MPIMSGTSEQEKANEVHFLAAHFFSIPSQGNVYTLTPLIDAKGHARLLVASLQRKVYCLEYTNGRPCKREVPFTYIPAGAEIISIDAINRSVIQEDFIIGITIIKKDDGKGQQSQFFNIYSDWDLNSDSALEIVSQNCLALHLDFVPYHLYHTQAKGSNGWETVWLLSGGDCCVHLYRSDEESYQKVNTADWFPEFKNLSDIVLRMDVTYSSDRKIRTSGVCCEGGTVEVFRVNVESKVPQVTASRLLSWDYPVASVGVFTLNTAVPLPKFLQAYRTVENVPEETECSPTPHVVVATTLESCYVYRDVLDSCDAFELPDSDQNDVVSCCLTCDIDHDGENEILIGTYEQSVIIYKRNRVDVWKLHHTLKVPCPVLALAYCDVMGDGSLELIVMTTTGIHIFQHNPSELAPLVLKRLKELVAAGGGGGEKKEPS